MKKNLFSGRGFGPHNKNSKRNMALFLMAKNQKEDQDVDSSLRRLRDGIKK